MYTYTHHLSLLDALPVCPRQPGRPLVECYKGSLTDHCRGNMHAVGKVGAGPVFPELQGFFQRRRALNRKLLSFQDGDEGLPDLGLRQLVATAQYPFGFKQHPQRQHRRTTLIHLGQYKIYRSRALRFIVACQQPNQNIRIEREAHAGGWSTDKSTFISSRRTGFLPGLCSKSAKSATRRTLGLTTRVPSLSSENISLSPGFRFNRCRISWGTVTCPFDVRLVVVSIVILALLV